METLKSGSSAFSRKKYLWALSRYESALVCEWGCIYPTRWRSAHKFHALGTHELLYGTFPLTVYKAQHSLPSLQPLMSAQYSILEELLYLQQGPLSLVALKLALLSSVTLRSHRHSKSNVSPMSTGLRPPELSMTKSIHFQIILSSPLPFSQVNKHLLRSYVPGLLYFVLANFMPTWHTNEVSERGKFQWRRCLHKVQL